MARGHAGPVGDIQAAVTVTGTVTRTTVLGVTVTVTASESQWVMVTVTVNEIKQHLADFVNFSRQPESRRLSHRDRDSVRLAPAADSAQTRLSLVPVSLPRPRELDLMIPVTVEFQ